MPACSAAEAISLQEPYINSTIANHVLALLARLFRHGRIAYHGGFVNLATGQRDAIGGGSGHMVAIAETG